MSEIIDVSATTVTDDRSGWKSRRSNCRRIS